MVEGTGEAEAGGFWVETKGDPKVRAQLAREKENAKRQQEELEQRQRQEEELRRAEDALVRQVASFIPVVPGTELSTITVSAYRIIPLLPFAPPSPKVHTMLVRMRPNEVRSNPRRDGLLLLDDVMVVALTQAASRRSVRCCAVLCCAM